MKIKSVRISVFILLAIAFTMLFPALARSQEARLKIGVLAKRGAEQCMEMWGPTAEYLTTMIPGFSFEVVPLDFDEIFTVVGRGEVDFILTNSSFYVEMEVKYGINRIVTLKNLRAGGAYTIFGGVIFCRADRSDIEHLSDLKGKSFMAVEETSLGGWRMAWQELKAKGIDPQRDLASLQFGGTHDVVVYAVRDGKIDVGTVRTDILERMAAEGKIELGTFRILDQRKIEDFPFVHSTRLYPEWPFAKVKHTSNEIAEMVTVALLQMPADSPAARAGKYAGWTIPANYQPVHECLKELRVGPYKEFGKITFSDVIKQYWYWFLTVAVFLILVSAATLYMLGLIHRLKQSRLSLEKELNQRKRLEEELTRHREHLEDLVNDRTASLREKNEELQFEIAERKRVGEELRKHRDHLEELVKGRTRELEEKTIELEQANTRLQEVDRLKSLFLANISHELRTPLNSIIGFTGVILQGISGELNDEQKKQLNMVYDSAKHLLRLINDILDLSKIEEGKIEIIPARFEVKDLIQTVEKMVSPMIEEKGLTFEVAISRDVPPMIYNDKNRIKQVLINLVSNAIKFNESGEIRLTVKKVSCSELRVPGSEQHATRNTQHATENFIVFSVSDTGIGIKPEHLSDIFDEFKQIEGPLKEKPAGTGLGLAISKKIVEMMGGRIWAESKYGKGSCFQFTIPIKEITDTKERP